MIIGNSLIRLYDVSEFRASNGEIAADYTTAWLGYLIQENGTASEDCITIGCISLEVDRGLSYYSYHNLVSRAFDL